MGLLRKKKDKGQTNTGTTNSSSPHGSPAGSALLGHQGGPQDLAIAQIISALAAHGLEYDVRRAQKLLTGRFSHGDSTRAISLAFALRDAEDLILLEPSRHPFLGAENRGATCYLDALLFAMYSRSFPIFDALLYHPGGNDRTDRLVINLRLFVNLLRSGILITHDIVDMLRSSIADCGWEDARSPAQQDSSECFGFIAEMLQMPNLTFKVHIAHGGKQDTGADHKIVQERFLALSIPEPPRNTQSLRPIELVDLIDAYFHTKLEVRRPVARSRSTLLHANLSGFHQSESSSASMKPPPYLPKSPSPTNPFSGNRRITSREYPEEKKKINKKDKESEVAMLAWQLFELVPYYSATDSSARQQDFSQQPPVVAVCLKRYYFDCRGTAHINPTPIIIPEYIDFTPFTDTENTIRKSGKQVRLRLESAVCHRGHNVGSGHYVSVSRGEHVNQWLLFDDLAHTRVTQGSFQQLFTMEIPYLLFYQLETISPPRRMNPRMPSIPNFWVSDNQSNIQHEFQNDQTSVPTAPYPIDPQDQYFPPRPIRHAPPIPETSKPRH